MVTYKIAHVNIQNQDMIFVLLDRQFGYRTEQEQEQFARYLQGCATSAGLKGHVVPTWEAPAGRSMFRGPQEWHTFFGSINLQWVWASVNKELTCN